MEEMHPDFERILISKEAVQERVKEMAKQLEEDHSSKDQLLLIGILKGAFIFMADLGRYLKIPHSVDFMAVSSYGASTTSGAVRILMDPRIPLGGKHVIIVEDIVDTGATLSYLYRILRGRKPASLKTCVFLRKQREALDVPIDYLGFEIPDVWVVGYGLDFADTYRTLPFVAELSKEVYQNK